MSHTARNWDSRVTYAGPEFHHWANVEELIPAERFLIKNYLNACGTTLEAGTGGGRILRALGQAGFQDRWGFDNIPALIEQARAKDPTREAAYSVQDARELSYPDEQFDQVIYLQQITCFISDPQGRQDAVLEANRVLKPGGTALFSFLCYDLRVRSLAHRAVAAYVACLRALTLRERTPQVMPWLRVAQKINHRVLLDRPPYGYWFRMEEALSLLTSQNFEIVAVGTKPQTERELCSSLEELRREPLGGLMLYVVCRKLTGFSSGQARADQRQ